MASHLTNRQRVEVVGILKDPCSVTASGARDGPSNKVVDVSYPGPGQLIMTRNNKVFHTKNRTVKDLIGCSRNEHLDETRFSCTGDVPGF
jgi:hypothetical protein